VFYHYKKIVEELAMISKTVSQIREIQVPWRRQITKKEIPKLSDSDILGTKDANRLIKIRREKKTIQVKKRLDKQ
jgi:hypothetical protein